MAGVEELLVVLDDLVDALSGEPEVLGDERAAVGREDAVGQLKVEEPVADAGRHLTGAVDEELVLGLVVQQPVLDGVLVVGDADRRHARQVEAVEVSGVLALRVVPEHDPVVEEAALQVRPDGGDFAHADTPIWSSGSGSPWAPTRFVRAAMTLSSRRSKSS